MFTMKTHLASVLALAAMGSVLSAGESGPAAPAAPAKPTASDATLFPVPVIDGPLWERERLFGNWLGIRKPMADHGVQLDFNLTQIYQGVVSGGETDNWAGDVGDAALNELADGIRSYRGRFRGEIDALARARLDEIRAGAGDRWDRLDDDLKRQILEHIAGVPPERWREIRRLLRRALRTKLADGKEALGKFVQDKIDGLNFGDYGNTGDDRWEYSGLWTAELKLDTGKMGLWPGGFLLMRVQGQYGDAVNQRSGALLPVNINSILPSPGLDVVTIPHLQVTQFLSEHLAVSFGKMDTTVGDQNDFAHITGDDRFVNMAFAFNPVTARTVPYSPLGAAIVVLPTPDVIFNVSAVDTQGVPTSGGFETAFTGNTTYAAELTWKTKWFGLPGHQLVGGTDGHGKFVEFEQDPVSLVKGETPDRAGNSWSAYYNFQQYLWTLPGDDTRGVGVFGRFGIADKRTNPIQQFYSAGVGGRGFFKSRPHDRFGVGYYYSKTSDDLPDFLQLRDEQGAEVFYTFAVTPGFLITPDVQAIRPARKDVDTSWIVGVRATMRF